MDRLPSEVLFRIANCLAMDDAEVMARINKKWRVAAEKVIWRVLVIARVYDSDDEDEDVDETNVRSQRMLTQRNLGS